jgi:hypothetical protein
VFQAVFALIPFFFMRRVSSTKRDQCYTIGGVCNHNLRNHNLRNNLRNSYGVARLRSDPKSACAVSQQKKYDQNMIKILGSMRG